LLEEEVLGGGKPTTKGKVGGHGGGKGEYKVGVGNNKRRGGSLEEPGIAKGG